ncbi:uncharacterized protein LOC117635271 [Prunus dulcis]|uniref:uncharacterized protein LOC117635271 n=1 Tax=Prunus dulcis TaxID=3755 RepID=UPI0014826C5E|nr:uncharacterized protein LOC117635271 [Prunus dulcis]
MVVTEIVVSAVLLREENSIQQPIFYVSKSLIEAEKRYTLAEKLVLALVTAKWKLRQYFEAHTIIVLTTQPIKAVMSKPDLSGRVTKWAIELGAFDIRYQPRTAQKGQAGAGVGIVLSLPEGVDLEYSVRLNFPTSNNVAEYEVLVLGLQLARTLKVGRLVVHSDSRLIVSHITDEYATKDERIGAYQRLVKDLASKFEKIEFKRILREMNVQADRLAHAASTSVEDMRVAPVELLSSPSIPIGPGVMQIDVEEETWMTLIMNYLTKGTQPSDPIEARKLRIKAAKALAIARWGMDIVGPLPTAVGGKKFILLATDYFTKWVEAEAYKTVTQTDVVRFVWRNIFCRFGIPRAIVTDNRTQFDNHKFRSYCEENWIIQQFSSQNHPQGNGQAEKTNRTIFDCLKRRLEQCKCKWSEELPNVLWAYRITKRKPTDESPFSLAYGTEAVITTESGLPTVRTLVVESNDNEQQLAHNLDMLEEQQEVAALRLANYQNQAANYFNKRVRHRKFKLGEWVLKKVMENTKDLNAGKFRQT